MKRSNLIFASVERRGVGRFAFNSASVSKRSAASPYNTGMDLIDNAIYLIFFFIFYKIRAKRY